MFVRLPLTALRTFECAARLRSFRRAADELSVTPTAVSHQIRSLEHWLGAALFERLPRGVALTTAGERLFDSVHGALLDIQHAADALRPRPDTGQVLLSTNASFAALWLVPRLGQFYARHPTISVCIDTRAALVDLHQDASVDLVIRYGEGEWPTLDCHQRLAETFGVYGTPTQVAAATQTTPTLITVQWQDSTLYQRLWQQWCAQAGETWLAGAPLQRVYDEEHHALQAAIGGQGLVMASSVMVSAALGSGLLVPYRPDIRVPGACYQVLSAPGRSRHSPVRVFLDWLQVALR